MFNQVLLFQSDVFSLEPPLREGGLPYDLPLGDDICAFLKARLESNEVAWSIGDPVHEDFGAVLMLERGKEVFTMTTSWQGENEWALVIGERRGCLGMLFNRKPNTEARMAIDEIKRLVNEIVLTDSERFKNPTWITEEEFPGVGQNFQIPE